MDLEVISKYDASRNLSDKSFRAACYAPFVSLLFDPLGEVRVCCKNFTHVIGNVGEKRLDEIWMGAPVQQIRKAMEKYNFNLGCDFCRWQITEGDYTGAAPIEFDAFSVDSTTPLAPQLMEFNISNTCNLECIMCCGEFSSAIRGRREKLPPIRKPYTDQFFEDIRKYLPNLKMAKCLGGEPFLAHEMQRLWDMMIEDQLQVRCHINTNATTWNEKVERVLDRLPCTFQISMDGITKETLEAVRVNAKFETVMENFHRFLAYSKSRPGGYLSITFCLMRQNWRELGDMLLFGDAQDCHVSILPVVTPSTCSLYTLPVAELAQIVHELEKQEAVVLPKLGRNAAVWSAQVSRLRSRLGHQEGPKPVFASLRLLEPFHGAENAPARQSEPRRLEAELRRQLEQWGSSPIAALICDAEDRVLELHSETNDFLGVSSKHCIGKRVDVVVSQFRWMHGGATDIARVDEQPEYVDRTLSFSGVGGKKVFIRSISIPRWNESGELVGSLLLAAQSDRLGPVRAAESIV